MIDVEWLYICYLLIQIQLFTFQTHPLLGWHLKQPGLLPRAMLASWKKHVFPKIEICVRLKSSRYRSDLILKISNHHHHHHHHHLRHTCWAAETPHIFCCSDIPGNPGLRTPKGGPTRREVAVAKKAMKSWGLEKKKCLMGLWVWSTMRKILCLDLLTSHSVQILSFDILGYFFGEQKIWRWKKDAPLLRFQICEWNPPALKSPFRALIGGASSLWVRKMKTIADYDITHQLCFFGVIMQFNYNCPPTTSTFL